MKGIRAYEVGGPDVLKYEDMPEPGPAPGEAIVVHTQHRRQLHRRFQPQGDQPAGGVSLDTGTRGFRRSHRHR